VGGTQLGELFGGEGIVERVAYGTTRQLVMLGS
jgi:hypothetical protein